MRLSKVCSMSFRVRTGSVFIVLKSLLERIHVGVSCVCVRLSQIRVCLETYAADELSVLLMNHARFQLLC